MPDIYYRVERALIKATGDEDKYYQSAGIIENICKLDMPPEERAERLLALLRVRCAPPAEPPGRLTDGRVYPPLGTEEG